MLGKLSKALYKNRCNRTFVKKEIAKVKANHPKKYYICCSKELTPQNKQDIYAMFSGYMESTANIITLIEISDFLDRPENADILHKHFKLWIESTNILTDIFTNDIRIDSEALLCDIEESVHMFVKTSAYDYAISCLEKSNVLIIVGNPGVGKTITSKMLVLYYAALGFRVRYTTDGADLASLKKALSQSPDTKEVILLDDCFGQAYFSMKETQENELLVLIKYLKMNSNKLLIMNSRVTIYREAMERTPNLVKVSQWLSSWIYYIATEKQYDIASSSGLVGMEMQGAMTISAVSMRAGMLIARSIITRRCKNKIIVTV